MYTTESHMLIDAHAAQTILSSRAVAAGSKLVRMLTLPHKVGESGGMSPGNV